MLARDPEKVVAFGRRGVARARAGGFGRQTAVSPASAAQREKVLAEGCRISTAHEHDEVVPADVAAALAAWTGWGASIDPMHVVDRSLGGCDHVDCVVGGARPFHIAYDAHRLAVLRYLSVSEQAHAVTHFGIVSMLQRATGAIWTPLDDSMPAGVDRLPEMSLAEQAEAVADVGAVAALELLTGERWAPQPRQELVA